MVNKDNQIHVENNNIIKGELSALAGIFNQKLILPLEMKWQPKEDITVYELALCLPYLIYNYNIMPYQIDETLPHFRHFKIINRNK